MFTFKWKKVPETNNEKEISVIQAWRVTWNSCECSGDYSSMAYLKEQAEFFTNEQQAKEFKESLENAFKLIKNSGRKITTVSLVKEQ